MQTPRCREGKRQHKDTPLAWPSLSQTGSQLPATEDALPRFCCRQPEQSGGGHQPSGDISHFAPLSPPLPFLHGLSVDSLCHLHLFHPCRKGPDAAQVSTEGSDGSMIAPSALAALSWPALPLPAPILLERPWLQLSLPGPSCTGVGECGGGGLAAALSHCRRTLRFSAHLFSVGRGQATMADFNTIPH